METWLLYFSLSLSLCPSPLTPSVSSFFFSLATVSCFLSLHAFLSILQQFHSLSLLSLPSAPPLNLLLMNVNVLFVRLSLSFASSTLCP